MFETMMVATDGSEQARKAVAAAGHLAGKCGARLIVVHVLTGDPIPQELRRLAEVEHLVEEPKAPPPATGRLSIDTSRRADEARLAAAVARKILDEAVAAAKREGAERIETLEPAGAAAEMLIDAALERGADLVVVGSRGFGAISGLVLGSVSRTLGHELACPLLIVK